MKKSVFWLGVFVITVSVMLLFMSPAFAEGEMTVWMKRDFVQQKNVEFEARVNAFAEMKGIKVNVELIAYEELGLCGAGECARLIDEGIVEIGGKFPVNTSGGLMSKGEPVGASAIGQMVHLVHQLRGNASPVQVEGAKVGLSHVIGAGGNCAVTILKT